MTLEEKIGQMNQYSGFVDVTGPMPNDGQQKKRYEYTKKGWVGSMLNVRGAKEVRAVQKMALEQSRLKIPMLFGFDVIHGYKTISPIPLAEAASWDLEAIQKSAEMAAAEAAASGLNWTFAPMVDITRDARWGRVMEGAGEDPYLGSRIAEARVKGFQGNFSEYSVAACVKHFAGYGFSESGRDYNTVDVGNSTLQNVVFPPFKAASDAGALTFMNSFNELNGVPATGNSYLQRDILKRDWNFDGFVVSDWGSIGEMINHGQAKNLKEAAAHALIAGSDMDMESAAYVEHLAELVREGKVSEELINDAARRILKVKFKLGLFEDPYKFCDENREKATIGKKAFREQVRDMAEKSIVLLKNEKNLLPLNASGQKIAVIGALASDKTSPLGSWRIGADDETAVSVLEGLSAYPKNTYDFKKGADVTTGKTQFVFETPINTTNTSGFADAIAAAKKADVVLMVLGEHGLLSGEGRSRTEIGLPGVQQQLLEAVYKANPNIVLVLMNGRPLAIPWAAEHIPAILETWHLGTESGNAIARTLFGDVNPIGKLPMSFPRSVGQLPLYYNHKNTGRPVRNEPESVFWSHYIDQENTPQYPFGFGLSYTGFSISPVAVSGKMVSKTGTIEASVKVTNTGKRSGTETVQLYIRDLVASATRPVRELKGFKQVTLNPGETKTVSFTIDAKLLEFWSADEKWETEAGEFEIYIGNDSNTTNKTVIEYK